MQVIYCDISCIVAILSTWDTRYLSDQYDFDRNENGIGCQDDEY